MASMCGHSCSCSPQSSTCARRIASAKFSDDMSHPEGDPQARPGPAEGPLHHPTPGPGPHPPSNTRSLGDTMGSSARKGTNTSWPSASRPKLTVPACVSEP